MIAIAAIGPDRAIGYQGRLPWHLPADLKFFKHTTTGHAVLMGRRTFLSIGKPLPNRLNFVLSRSASPDELPGTTILRSPEDIPSELPDGRRLFLIGGAQLYTALLPRCTELLLTHVLQPAPADTFFPPFEHLFRPAEILLETPDFLIRRWLPIPDATPAP